jgi:hypothetical protein
MPTAGLKTIISLSFVLAVGFLLVILSCALYKVYYPLLVVATYVLAPLPNWICSRCANPDDFVESSGNAVLDLGRFCTGFLVVMGFGKSIHLLLYCVVVSEGAWKRRRERAVILFGMVPCRVSMNGAVRDLHVRRGRERNC